MDPDDLFRIAGKTIIVTGGAGGIGSSICRSLAVFGAHVVVADIEQKAADAVAHKIIENGNKAISFKVDVTLPEQVDQLVELCRRNFGGVDILFNNAGVGVRRNLLEQPLDEWKRILDVNLTGMLICSQHCVPCMIKKGSGRIINMASLSAVLSRNGRGAYGASKAAVVQLTKTMAKEWAPYNIIVNAIAPGIVDTPFNDEVKDIDYYKKKAEEIPLGRIAFPDDLLGAVIFFSSSASNYITGQTLYIDGGRLTE